MEICQIGPMPEAPISDALAVAFGLLRKRAKGAKGAEAEEERQWVSLDALLEHALKTIRQEMTFWQRSGVFGDIRQYVESAMIAQGYLIEPSRPTWLDRVRTQRPMPHIEGIMALEAEAEELAAQMAMFRATHGGNLLPADERETEVLRQADTALLCPADANEIPLDEMMRMSIYETLLAIKQLEPSGDAGV